MRSGWFGESYRHYLAAKRVKTAVKPGRANEYIDWGRDVYDVRDPRGIFARAKAAREAERFEKVRMLRGEINAMKAQNMRDEGYLKQINEREEKRAKREGELNEILDKLIDIQERGDCKKDSKEVSVLKKQALEKVRGPETKALGEMKKAGIVVVDVEE